MYSCIICIARSDASRRGAAHLRPRQAAVGANKALHTYVFLYIIDIHPLNILDMQIYVYSAAMLRGLGAAVRFPCQAAAGNN